MIHEDGSIMKCVRCLQIRICWSFAIDSHIGWMVVVVVVSDGGDDHGQRKVQLPMSSCLGERCHFYRVARLIQFWWLRPDQIKKNDDDDDDNGRRQISIP